jgi:DDE superfamily endonuclease/Helix-turn-helix of DDE superfamily endonuclease
MKMKPYAKITTKKPAKFKRLVGISQDNFNRIVDWLKSYQAEIKKHNSQKRRGLNTSKVSHEDRVLLTFYYLRHYPTFDNLAQIFNISESYCQKIYTKTVRMLAKILKLPSRKEFLTKGFDTLIIDVSEQRIEKPLKHQKAFYSGKKHHHTIKAQLIVCALTLQILSVVVGKGRQHDFSLFKASRLLLDPTSQLLADSGYQGIVKYHLKSTIPFKKKKGQSLTIQEKAHNKALSKKRISIENVNRQCKIFRIVKDIYRGKHKNYTLNWHLVAAIVNFRYASV